MTLVALISKQIFSFITDQLLTPSWQYRGLVSTLWVPKCLFPVIGLILSFVCYE